MSDSGLPLRWRALLISAALLTVLVARPELQTAGADWAVPFKVGETLTFDISWTSFVSAGTATFSVKERRPAGPGRNAYYLIAEAKPSSVIGKLYSLYYKAESMLDTRSLLPSVATLYSDEGGRKRQKTTTFRGNGAVQYELKTATTATSSLKVPVATQDPLGAIYILRALPLKVGLAVPIPITDSGKAYTMRIKVAARELVRIGLGSLPAWKVSTAVTDAAGKATDASAFTVWISDDERKLPLKFQAGLTVGSVQLTLAKVTG